jgi:hypothetical protein
MWLKISIFSLKLFLSCLDSDCAIFFSIFFPFFHENRAIFFKALPSNLS